MNGNGNGANKLIWSIMLSACGLLATGMLVWLTSLSERATVSEAVLASRSERISSLEAATASIDRRLSRIEAKLDQVVDLVVR